MHITYYLMALAVALPLLATGYYIVLSLSSTEPDYPKLCALADALIRRFCLLTALPLGGAEMCDCGSAESLYSVMLHAGMALNVAIAVLIIYLGFIWVPDLRTQFAMHLAEQHAPKIGAPYRCSQ